MAPANAPRPGARPADWQMLFVHKSISKLRTSRECATRAKETIFDIYRPLFFVPSQSAYPAQPESL